MNDTLRALFSVISTEQFICTESRFEKEKLFARKSKYSNQINKTDYCAAPKKPHILTLWVSLSCLIPVHLIL